MTLPMSRPHRNHFQRLYHAAWYLQPWCMLVGAGVVGVFRVVRRVDAGKQWQSSNLLGLLFLKRAEGYISQNISSSWRRVNYGSEWGPDTPTLLSLVWHRQKCRLRRQGWFWRCRWYWSGCKVYWESMFLQPKYHGRLISNTLLAKVTMRQNSMCVWVNSSTLIGRTSW